MPSTIEFYGFKLPVQTETHVDENDETSTVPPAVTSSRLLTEALLSRLDLQSAGYVAGYVAGLVSYRHGEAVSFESVVQKLFSLYKKLHGVSDLAATRTAFDQFKASAQAAYEQFKSTLLSSAVTISFSAFGVGLGAWHSCKYVHGRVKNGLSDIAGRMSGGKSTAALGTSGKTDSKGNVPPDTCKDLLDSTKGDSISSRPPSRQSSRDLDDRKRDENRKDNIQHTERLSTGSNPNQGENSARGAVATVDQSSGGRTNQHANGLAGKQSSSGEKMSDEQFYQLINGVIMYLFPGLGGAVGSLAGASDQQASELSKAVSESYASLRSTAEKAGDSAVQGISSVAQAWAQSPN